MIAWTGVNRSHHSLKCRTHYKRIEELIAASPTPNHLTPSSRGKRQASELDDDDSLVSEDKEDDISMFKRIRLRSIKLIELNVKKAKIGEMQTLFEVGAENSTIRCFCNFPNDDGNTVMCEDCNNWQHIRCYYPQHPVPGPHVCALCRPRAVDRQGANEHQRIQRSAAPPPQRPSSDRTKSCAGKPQRVSHNASSPRTSPVGSSNPGAPVERGWWVAGSRYRRE